MSRLSELNQALIDVIVRFAASSNSAVAKEESSEADLAAAAASSPAVTILSGGNLPEMYVKLEALIEASTTVGSADSLFLRNLVNHILALEVFLKPVKIQALTAAENPPNPLHEQLIRGHKIPTSEELQQQLLSLALSAQQQSSNSTEFEADYIAVENEDPDAQEWLLTNEIHPDPQKNLRDNLFLALGLRTNASQDDVSAKLVTIFAEQEEVTRLAAENTRLTQLLEGSPNQLTNHIYQPTTHQQLGGSLSSRRIHFFTQAFAAVAGGLADIFFEDPDGRHTPPPPM